MWNHENPWSSPRIQLLPGCLVVSSCCCSHQTIVDHLRDWHYHLDSCLPFGFMFGIQWNMTQIQKNTHGTYGVHWLPLSLIVLFIHPCMLQIIYGIIYSRCYRWYWGITWGSWKPPWSLLSGWWDAVESAVCLLWKIFGYQPTWALNKNLIV